MHKEGELTPQTIPHYFRASEWQNNHLGVYKQPHSPCYPCYPCDSKVEHACKTVRRNWNQLHYTKKVNAWPKRIIPYFTCHNCTYHTMHSTYHNMHSTCTFFGIFGKEDMEGLLTAGEASLYKQNKIEKNA